MEIRLFGETGDQLHQPEKVVTQKNIRIDGEKSESEWEQATKVSPFLLKNDGLDNNNSVQVLYDRKNIYLYWEVQEEGGITSNMKKTDSLITDDDYIQIDLKPWLPDSIKYARNYYYTISINPDGVIWDSYFDPYLDGFFFTSGDSHIDVATSKMQSRWMAEVKIPYSG